ncbi:MAG TPA: TRAP transporter small permease [Candidatus Limiplasma sp.]|nr:TRAP transporter small permease [Candidatus Limiplasma sp.]HRX09070.1 TRAP transporter small permease [Candidatus Limiplasma sp.]
MYDRINDLIKKASKALAEIAGWLLFACMVIVTLNVILRKVFNSPLLGTYEWVGILTAVMISLGLAYCAVVGGHIAIDFIVNKMKPGVQRMIAMICGGISCLVMGGVAVSMFLYANKLSLAGEVSPTTKIPFYIFVYIAGVGFVFLLAVLLLDVYKTVRRKNHHES